MYRMKRNMILPRWVCTRCNQAQQAFSRATGSFNGNWATSTSICRDEASRPGLSERQASWVEVAWPCKNSRSIHGERMGASVVGWGVLKVMGRFGQKSDIFASQV
jgi:hypothetical protein